MEDKLQITERVKYYRAIHASKLYKSIVVGGDKEAWKEYLSKRFGVKSCTELDISTLKNFADGIYKKSEPTKAEDKVISLLPYIERKEQRESGTEGMTNKQSWTIKRDWAYLTKYLNPEANPVKAFETYIRRVCGSNANFENLNKKQASKLITAIKNWIKSIEG